MQRNKLPTRPISYRDALWPVNKERAPGEEAQRPSNLELLRGQSLKASAGEPGGAQASQSLENLGLADYFIKSLMDKGSVTL